MGSPITFSGFNQIDFTVVLNAIMQQESRPLQVLQAEQQRLQNTDANLVQLASKLDALRNAASSLSQESSLTSYAATASDAGVTVSASADAVAGRYDVVVNELARAQVTVSASTVGDTDTTVVATGGTVTIGGASIQLAGSVTLRQLADTINASTDAPASASIIETSPGAFRLVLSGKNTGEAGAFTVTNALTGSTLAFTDTDGDGVTGNAAGDNAVQATNASVTINNVAVTSATNTLQSGIPGVTVTLQQKDPAKTIVVTVARDDADLAARVSQFTTAFNDFVSFANDQATAAGKGVSGTLGRDSLLRNLRNSLRDALTAAYGPNDTHLTAAGIGFTRTGQLAFDEDALTKALLADPPAVNDLFAGASGAFTSLDHLITDYTRSGGLVPGARTRVSAEVSRVAGRMDDMQARLAVMRAALQKEFIAADQAMSRLNSQTSALSSIGSSLTTSLF